MNEIFIWNGVSPVNIDKSSPLPKVIKKVCQIDQQIFVLSNSGSVYRANISQDETPLVFEKLTSFKALDISSYGGELVFVEAGGGIGFIELQKLSRRNIKIKNNKKGRCLHQDKIYSVEAGNRGLLLITDNGQLLAAGCFFHINIDSEEPFKVTFFDGRPVYKTAIGENFALVVTRKNVPENDETESDNDDDVFVSTCTQCLSNSRFSSPGSQISTTDTYPLGVQFNKSSEESTGSAQHHETATYTEGTSSSPENDELEKGHTDELKSVERAEVLSPVEEIPDETVTDVTSLKTDEKTSTIFMNAEAAKQFLSKQLSWVSVGEDYLVECTEKPTRIFKENVSTLTNLVVEGVKTVGDKVVTLSRHMSGSSETNDNEKNEGNVVEELNPLYSLLSSCKLEDIQLSSSTVSEKDVSKHNLTEKIAMITKLGQNVLNSEVWAWGEVEYGQLGTGDKILRNQPVVISSLSNLGIHKISCGKFHSAALTLDGRVFTWGHNKWNQVSSDSNDDKSHPTSVIFDNKTDRAKDIQCGEYHTIILTQNENIYFAGKHANGFTTFVNLRDSIKTTTLPEPNKNGCVKSTSLRRLRKNLNFYSSLLDDIDVNNFLFASNNLSVFQIPAQNTLSVDPQALSVLQQYLEEIIFINQNLIKVLLKKTALMNPNSELYESLCGTYADILYFTAANVMSFLKFCETHNRPSEIIMIQYSEEHILLYSKYLKLFCNIICIGYNQIVSQLSITPALKNFVKTKYNISTVTPENTIYNCLMHLLDFTNIGKCIFQSLLSYNYKTNTAGEIKSVIDQKFTDALNKWDSFRIIKEKNVKEAESTRTFWNGNNKLVDGFCIPNRRLIKESKNEPISLLHPGRFSSHHFILFNDIFLHLNGSSQNIYNLNTIWVEPVVDTESVQNAILLTMPEETITLVAQTPHLKNLWLQAFQNTIKVFLKKEQAFQPPIVRTATYTYTNRSQLYKDAKYTGKWLNGKLHGTGKLQWSDGKIYIGNFKNNQIHGNGRMQMPNIGTYEGQWKDNMQNGFGVMKYLSGDIYEGFFKDGLAHGHGVRKQGDFTSSSATIYMGDWVQGMRQGYGVMDDIGKGEKYLGYWNDNKKQGYGLIVTLDGIYYEGVFNNGDLTGHGVMVFEDGTHYEGEFRSVGVFNGKGVLTFSGGGKFEGTLNGAWTDGVKVNSGTLHLNSSVLTEEADSKPKSFGKLSVPPSQKWSGLFSHCYQQFGIPYNNNNNGSTNSSKKGSQKPVPLPTDNTKIWQNVAVILSNAQKDSSDNTASGTDTPKKSALTSSENTLDVIPVFGQTTLTRESYDEVIKYLNKACDNSIHPLGQLIAGCAAAFTASYGGVRVHPLLLSHAVVEFLSLASRVYTIIRLLFPALPPSGEHISFSEDPENDFCNQEIVSDSVVVQSILLPRIHPTLHVLYALHHQKEDAAYWKRLLNWNRQTDVTLMAFLGVDQKFWIGYAQKASSESNVVHSPIKDQIFSSAVNTLQQLKTTFSPMEKIFVIRDTFKDITSAIQKELGVSFIWTMDELFPVFHFVVIRARILQLGSEIHFIEDFLDPCLQNGELDIMFTTLKACYHQILQEKVTIYE